MSHRKLSLAAVGFLFGLFSGWTTTASADPLLVTSGGLALHTSDPLDWMLSGNGFVFRGANFDLGDIGNEFAMFHSCCPLGGQMDVSARVTGLGRWTDVPRFPVEFNGKSYSTVYWSGDLSFDAQPVTLPASFTRTTLVAPFTLTGQLAAYGDPSRMGAPLFSAAVMGAGRVELGLLEFGVGDLDYVIQASAAPTPEPASLFLLATGIAAVAARSRWRLSRP